MGLCTWGRAGRLQVVRDVGQGWGGWGRGPITGFGFRRRVPAANETAAQPEFDPSFGIFTGKMLQEYRISLGERPSKDLIRSFEGRLPGRAEWGVKSVGDPYL